MKSAHLWVVSSNSQDTQDPWQATCNSGSVELDGREEQRIETPVKIPKLTEVDKIEFADEIKFNCSVVAGHRIFCGVGGRNGRNRAPWRGWPNRTKSSAQVDGGAGQLHGAPAQVAVRLHGAPA